MRISISFSCRGLTPFTVAWLPTGIKTGVSTVPWGVINQPNRAKLSEEVLINLNQLELEMEVSF